MIVSCNSSDQDKREKENTVEVKEESVESENTNIAFGLPAYRVKQPITRQSNAGA